MPQTYFRPFFWPILLFSGFGAHPLIDWRDKSPTLEDACCTSSHLCARNARQCLSSSFYMCPNLLALASSCLTRRSSAATMVIMLWSSSKIETLLALYLLQGSKTTFNKQGPKTPKNAWKIAVFDSFSSFWFLALGPRGHGNPFSDIFSGLSRERLFWPLQKRNDVPTLRQAQASIRKIPAPIRIELALPPPPKLHAQYDWTSGALDNRNEWGSSAPYLACTPCVPLFSTLFNRVEAEGFSDYQGRAGIISIVRWNPLPGHIQRRKTQKYPSSFKMRIVMAVEVSCRKSQTIPGAHKIGPRIAGTTVRKALDTFHFWDTLWEQLCLSDQSPLIDTPLWRKPKPVQILKHTTKNLTEKTAMRTKWFEHIAIWTFQEHLLFIRQEKGTYIINTLTFWEGG